MFCSKYVFKINKNNANLKISSLAVDFVRVFPVIRESLHTHADCVNADLTLSVFDNTAHSRRKLFRL